MGCEVYIDNDLYDDPWCQSCINSNSDITDKDTDNDNFTADKEVVWSLAYEEMYHPTILTRIWDFSTFDHFVALPVRWSVFGRHDCESTSEEQDEVYAEHMLDWRTITYQCSE